MTRLTMVWYIQLKCRLMYGNIMCRDKNCQVSLFPNRGVLFLSCLKISLNLTGWNISAVSITRLKYEICLLKLIFDLNLKKLFLKSTYKHIICIQIVIPDFRFGFSFIKMKKYFKNIGLNCHISISHIFNI